MKTDFIKDHSAGKLVLPGILAAIAMISLLHYLTNLEYQALHAVFQKLYYIPIIYTAFMFGSRGSIPVALAVSLLYLPHIFFQWGGPHSHHFADQISDLVMFNVTGLVTGILSDKEKMLRKLHREAYIKLQESFGKAEQTARMAAIGQISAAVAHEIRNPLNGIQGAQDILLEKFKPEDPEYRFVEIVKKEMSRLNGIITDFLEFARPRKPSIIITNLNNVAKAVSDLCRPQADAKNVGVKFVESEPELMAGVDVDQMRQVLLNLALNGIDACPPDGGEVNLSVARGDGEVIFTVSDTGNGLDEEVAKNLFEPFFTTKTAGTGLGLSVSNRIVENHGGKITFAGKPGGGTIFSVHLPV